METGQPTTQLEQTITEHISTTNPPIAENVREPAADGTTDTQVNIESSQLNSSVDVTEIHPESSQLTNDSTSNQQVVDTESTVAITRVSNESSLATSEQKQLDSIKEGINSEPDVSASQPKHAADVSADSQIVEAEPVQSEEDQTEGEREKSTELAVEKTVDVEEVQSAGSDVSYSHNWLSLGTTTVGNITIVVLSFCLFVSDVHLLPI